MELSGDGGVVNFRVVFQKNSWIVAHSMANGRTLTHTRPYFILLVFVEQTQDFSFYLPEHFRMQSC